MRFRVNVVFLLRFPIGFVHFCWATVLADATPAEIRAPVKIIMENASNLNDISPIVKITLHFCVQGTSVDEQREDGA